MKNDASYMARLGRVSALAVGIWGPMILMGLEYRKELNELYLKNTPVVLNELAYVAGIFSVAICKEEKSPRKMRTDAEISDAIYSCFEEGPMGSMFGEVGKWNFAYRYKDMYFPRDGSSIPSRQSMPIDFFRS